MSPAADKPEPLFIPSTEALKRSIRLSGVPLGTDAQSMIEEAILAVRIKIYEYVGVDGVDEILTTPYTPQPTTEAELRRAIAYKAELAGVKCELLKVLPVHFTDGSSRGDQAWNEEAFTRDSTTFDTEREIERCQLEFIRLLEELANPADTDLKEDSIRSDVVEKLDTNKYNYWWRWRR